MKKYFLNLFFVSLLIIYRTGISFAQVNPMPTDKHFKEIVESEMKAHAGKIKPHPLTTINDYDIKYHRCMWKVDPAIDFIAGNITTYFKPLAAGFDSIKFDLSDSLGADSVKYHGSSLAFTHKSNIVTAFLPATIPANTLDSITVFYKGVPPSSGFGSFGVGTHDTVNHTPVMWTLSEPYGASEWWPCKNSLTDKIDSVDIIVTTPAAYKVASNGLLLSVTPSGPDKIFRWKHRYPIATYLICFATTNYSQFSQNVPFGATNLPIQNYIYPEDSAEAASKFVTVVPVMQLYDTLFGVYPYVNEKYGMTQFGWGGGMEHQSMTFLGGFDHELTAHELGHQWFGDKVTCASWRDIWLNEGFATYLTGLTYEHMFGGIYWPIYKSLKRGSVTSAPNGSVWCSDTTSVNRIFDGRLSYDKGAAILHQLRWAIGDSAFFTALKNYLNDPKLSYGFAYTSDLKTHFETSSGQNLTWYFHDWFTGEGFPSYQITWNQSGNTVNLTVNQTASYPSSIPFFGLPLPIEFKDQTHDTIIRLNHTFSGQTFSVTLPFAVDSVKLDPDIWLISNGNTVTGIKEYELDKEISVFPNPATDKVQIIFGKIFSNMSLELMDVSGRTVKSLSANGMKSIVLDLNGCSKGNYILQFKSGGLITGKNIVIQ